ncbi:hypothetical protein [Corynebacterium nuruki]|jgi:hypothetical protein|uniref:AMIN-like domain-containing (lipo)protein n=1 Tax=Corynebacterium nuruki TaxID=1032851 RepID=UPI0023555FD6
MTSRPGLPRTPGTGVPAVSAVSAVSAALAAVLVAGTAVLSACSDDGDSPVPSTTHPASAATVSAPGAELGTPETEDGPLSGSQPVNVLPGDGTALVAAQIRVGAHSTYDRVVVEFDGTGSPGWDVGLTDHPTADGSGLPVDFSGRQAMTIDLRGIDMNATADRAAAGKDATPPVKLAKDTGAIRSVKAAGAFEGQQRVVVGLADRNPEFRVNLLSSPTRLVIDVMRR